jgi:hypothetical protein
LGVGTGASTSACAGPSADVAAFINRSLAAGDSGLGSSFTGSGLAIADRCCIAITVATLTEVAHRIAAHGRNIRRNKSVAAPVAEVARSTIAAPNEKRRQQAENRWRRVVTERYDFLHVDGLIVIVRRQRFRHRHISRRRRSGGRQSGELVLRFADMRAIGIALEVIPVGARRVLRERAPP